ncbi:MAG TPA: YidC/Oxa1 family membrane protein insertase [Candidatus Acidoferrales bacterium]|nr:YidC/Oxa1 family membrane protein insertase [Candidatus Acidoferrales bacterium]
MTPALAPLLFAFNPFAWFFNPLVAGLQAALIFIYGYLHNYGWSVIVLAALVKAALWWPSALQFKSMSKMQQLAPQIKALQNKYKGKDPETQQKLNSEMMALYKENGANPFAGCLPAIIPLPVMWAFYQAIKGDNAQLSQATWLWIGSPISRAMPHIFATSLAHLDLALLIIYMVSMFFTVRLSSAVVDEQQAQQQRIMAFMSPAMIGYFGYRYAWPSALILYWLTFNVCSVIQQFILMRRYPRTPPPSAQPVVPLPRDRTANRSAPKNATPANPPAARKKRAR